MSATRDPDHILHAWLEEGPTVLPAPTVRAIEVATRATAQRRPAIRLPWRSDLMPLPYKLLSAAAALAVVLVGGALLLGTRSEQSAISGPSPSPTPSVTPVPSPTLTASANLLDTATWTTYVSNRYGFSIGHPAGWTVVPADHDWTFAADVDWLSTGAEAFLTAVDQGIRMTAWSVAIEPGTTLDAWLQAYCPLTMVSSDDKAADCPAVIDQASAATIDGHDGLLVPFPKDTQAFFQVGDRLYAVAIWRPETHPSVVRYSGTRRLVEAVISTMRLLPAGPAPSASTASPS